MAFLSPAQLAAIRGSSVRAALLVEMRFRSQTMRVWNGAGIADIAGAEWSGIGHLGSIDGLQQTRGTASAKVTLRLSGISAEVVALANNSTEDVEGRPCVIWQQLLTEDWQPLGTRILLFWGTMQRLGISREAAEGVDGGQRVCELDVENPFAGRARPFASRWTDADQKARFPGDKFCRFVSQQRQVTVSWPNV